MTYSSLSYRIRSKDNKIILIIYVISVLYIVFTPFVKSFSYVDELSTLFLGGYAICTLPILKKKEFLIALGVLAFYLGYPYF